MSAVLVLAFIGGWSCMGANVARDEGDMKTALFLYVSSAALVLTAGCIGWWASHA